MSDKKENEIDATEAATLLADANGIDLKDVKTNSKTGRIGQPDVQNHIDALNAKQSGDDEGNEGSQGDDGEGSEENTPNDDAESNADDADDSADGDTDTPPADTPADADEDEGAGEPDDEAVVESGKAIQNFKFNRDRYKIGDTFEGSEDDAAQLRSEGLIA